MGQAENILSGMGRELAGAEQRLVSDFKRIPHFRHDHPPVRDVNQEFQDSFTPLEKVALFVTDHVGTPGFFLIIFGWTVLWLGWNTIGPRADRFDPAPAFVFWLFVSNMIQIMLMPLIMVGQNLSSRHAEMRAQSDFEINQKAEKEVEVILLHLERQAAQIERQEQLMLEILRRLTPETPSWGSDKRLVGGQANRREASLGCAPRHHTGRIVAGLFCAAAATRVTYWWGWLSSGDGPGLQNRCVAVGPAQVSSTLMHPRLMPISPVNRPYGRASADKVLRYFKNRPVWSS